MNDLCAADIVHISSFGPARTGDQRIEGVPHWHPIPSELLSMLPYIKD